MLIQTDLYSFSFKLGTLVPWCKNCGAQNFYRDGKNDKGKQLYKCKNCGFRFVWSSDLPRMNFFSNIISFAVDLYSTVGISLRTIAQKMEKFFCVKISYEGIRQWILKCSKLHMPNIQPVSSKVWHADETYIKIKGKGFWLWIVYCHETRVVLAWHISKKRLFKDAKAVLKKAKDNAGMRPEKIITDGLYQYQAAIKKVFGWKWNIYKKSHIVDSGIGKNAILERLNREVKRRIKWFGTFQALDGAKAFFNMFFYYHNFQKINRTIGCTPNKRACVKDLTLVELLYNFPTQGS